MKQMKRDDLPSEGIEILGFGRIMPSQEIEVPDEIVEVMIRKGFKIAEKKSKEGIKDDMGHGGKSTNTNRQRDDI